MKGMHKKEREVIAERYIEMVGLRGFGIAILDNCRAAWNKEWV